MSKAGKDGISALIKKYNSSDSNLQDSRSRKSTVISKDLMKTINSKLGDTGFVDEAVKFAPRKPLPALVVQPHPPSRRDFKAIGSKDFFCETPSNVETIIRSRVANRIAEMNLTPIGNRLSRNSPPSPTQEALGISSTQSPSRNSTKSRLQAEKSAQTKERLREFAQEEKHAIDEDTGETLETKFVGIEVSESANDSSTASSLNTVELDSLALNEKLISFVSLIGMDHDQIFGLEDLSIMSDNFVAHLKGLSLPTKELEIAPALTKRKNIYPPGLSLFVFPKGATLQTSQRKPFFHQFVLTIADGSRLYGHSVSIPIKSNDEDLTKCRSMIGSYLLRNPHAEIEFAQMPSEFYFPRALVILSPHPYHNSFLRILQDYVEMIASEGILSSHVSLLYEKLNAPAPLYSINSVEISLFSQAKILFRTPNFSEPPLCDLNFGILFRYLEPRHAILILNALLCECPVIIKSHHIELLTPCCEALLALLYPFKWPFLYIPVLPKSLIDILQAPQPFLIGAYSKLLDHCDPVSHVWVVDLDRSRITPPSKNAPQFVELPWRLVWRLFRSINMHMNYYKFYHPRSKIIHPDCLPENATNNDQELDISSSFLGSKSILSYKTVSDLFSGSESEENDSNLKSKGNDFLNPDLWIHPGEYSQSGMQSDNSLNSPEGKQLSSPLAEYRNAFSYHNNSDVLSIANGSSQESEEVRRGTKPLNHSLPVDRQSVSKRASRYIRSSRLRFFSVDRHSSDDDEMQNENTKFNGRVPLKVDVLKFRSQCLSIYVSLLAKYREYIQISEEPVEEEIISLFNTSACLKEVDNTKRDFLFYFFNTQMFSFFLEERVGRKEPDWFDCKCLNKLQHEAASLHKQIHRKQKVGYLWKLGKNFKTWKRRLFVLDERLILRYYVPSQKLTDLIEMEQSLLTSLSSTVNPVIMKKLQEEIKKLSKELAPLKKSYLKGSISLIEGETEISLPETTTKVYKTAYPFKIITNSRNLVVCAEDVNSRRDWVRLLSTKIQKTPTSFKKFPQTRAFHGTTAPFRPLYQSSVKDQLSLLLAKELSSVIRSSISC